MGKAIEVWVFGDHRHASQKRLTRQVLGQAHLLSGEKGRVTLILLGYEIGAVANEFVGYGAHRILMIDHPDVAIYNADLFTSLLCDLVREQSPDIFLLGASEFGTELAARVAKRLGVGLSAECTGLVWDPTEEKLVATSPAFGGQLLAQITWSRVTPYMATLSPGAFIEQPYDPLAQTEIVRLERIPDPSLSKIKVISSVYEPHKSVKLEEAKIVVSGGRGVRNYEGFHTLRELASLIGGEIGATRPAVDAHWTTHDHLIGQTGKAIRPDLLITCGTSGAVQYTAGIRGARTIVAVNRDPHAPIFKSADIGVIADSSSFLPAFISEVKAALFKEITELYRATVTPGVEKKGTTFGQRIKKLREDQKMTITDLAEKTGQSPEFIEQVEDDLLTPPVSFLLQLSNALRMDPSSFLTDQEKAHIEGKRQEGFIKRTQNYSYRTLTPGAADKHLRAFMVTIEPRATHKMIEYKHPGEEFIFVYKGELELTLGGKVLHLKQGETIHFDSETKHKLRNLSDERCELIVTLYTP